MIDDVKDSGNVRDAEQWHGEITHVSRKRYVKSKNGPVAVVWDDDGNFQVDSQALGEP